mgnify:CR=1 FL=1
MQTGIKRLFTIDDMFDSILMHSSLKMPGKKLAIISNAGGPGVISTDCLAESGLKLQKLSKHSKDKLSEFLPKTWSHANPIDIIGDATPERFEKTIKSCLEDKTIESILVLLTPQAMTDPKKVARLITSIKIPKDKFVFTSFIGGDEMMAARDILKKSDIPTFYTPNRAVSAFSRLVKNEIKGNGKTLNLKMPTKREDKIIAKAIVEKRKALTEAEAKAFLASLGVPVLKSGVASTENEAIKIAKQLGLPVAMKILSADILHKTDIGGVKLGVASVAEVKRGYLEIIKNAKAKNKKAKIEGVFIEPMSEAGIELIIGLNLDPVLGPVIMFGRGGVEVELYNDLAFGVLPLGVGDIRKMINKTKVSKLLRGYRGMKGVDIEKIIKIIYSIASIAEEFPDIKELDINPLVIKGDKAFVLDAKIVLK